MLTMHNASALMLLGALAGSLVTYGMLSSDDRHQAVPRLGVDESEAMRVAATGTWRAVPNALTTSDPGESATATEVVMMPAAKFQTVVQKSNAVGENRGSITIDLQRELARVGCYDGEINGAWTTSTRQAMKAFMERVNATLPINQPDPVLLALVQGHAAKVCGASCPPGQGLAGDGRCMSTAILAPGARKDSKQLTSSPSGWSTTTTVAPDLPSSLSEGQMALAGLKTEIDANTALPAKSVQPNAPRPRTTRDNYRGDWRAELWKRQN
jgi:hypothetical protein